MPASGFLRLNAVTCVVRFLRGAPLQSVKFAVGGIPFLTFACLSSGLPKSAITLWTGAAEVTYAVLTNSATTSARNFFAFVNVLREKMENVLNAILGIC